MFLKASGVRLSQSVIMLKVSKLIHGSSTQIQEKVFWIVSFSMGF